MKAIRITFFVLFINLLFVSGCQVTTNANPNVDDVPNDEAQEVDDITTDEDISPQQPEISLQLACLPYEHTKTNKLQDVIVILSEYLSGALTPIPSYDLDITKEYLLVAEITMPNFLEDPEYAELIQSKELRLEFYEYYSYLAESQITDLSCSATITTSTYRDLQCQRTSALFCGNNSNTHVFSYFCSAFVAEDNTLQGFLDCSNYDNFTIKYNSSNNTHSLHTRDLSDVKFDSSIFDAPGRVLIVYEVKNGVYSESANKIYLNNVDGALTVESDASEEN